MQEIQRIDIEDFLYREADTLDRWALDEWLALWSEDREISYEVAPTGEEDASNLSHKHTMFLIADDRYRLGQRIVRMKKNTFHAEYVRSHTRHLYANVRIIERAPDILRIAFNSAVYRSRKGTTIVYPTSVRMDLQVARNALKMVRKRIELGLDYLDTMGSLSILL